MIISCNILHLLYPPTNNKDTGLGNTLFQLATMYALSKEYNLEMNIHELLLYCNILNNFGFEHEKKIFKKFLNTYDCSYSQKEFIKICESENNYVEQFLDKHFLNRIQESLQNNIKIEGYFQSHLYFDKYREDILNLFEIDNYSLDYIKNKYSVLFDADKMCISIHIRMNYAGNINYNSNYFIETINFFKKIYSNIHFLIFSNNIDLVNEWFPNNDEYTYVTGNIDYIDLWIMSLCKHNIISHSTFSWWGAYLNNNPDKIITYPIETLRIKQGNLYDEILYPERFNEYYMPEWIGFDTNSLYRYYG